MKRLALLLALLLLIVTGCSHPLEEPLNTDESTAAPLHSGHMEQIHDYDSPYTIFYRNADDTYTMYIYASPIQYKAGNNYTLIDNTIIPSEKEGFAFENKANEVKTYFPNTLDDDFRVEKGSDYLEFRPAWDIEGFSEGTEATFTNMYGDPVSAVIYERNDMDAVFYPTKAGIKSELVLKDSPDSSSFIFTVHTNSPSWDNKQNGYISFQNSEEIQSIIYAPLVQYDKDGMQQLDTTTQIELKKEEGNTFVSMTLDADILDREKTTCPIRFDPSFEIYLNKMPDTTVYSDYEVNNYLANYAVIGDHPTFGTGWHYLRVRLNWFLELEGSQIISATYSIRNLYSAGDNAKVQLLDLSQQWSSTQMLWSTRTQAYQNYLKCEGDSGKYLDIEITDFVQKAVDDTSWMEESHGLLLQGPEEGTYAIFATSDNGLYPPYLRLDLNALPNWFSPQDNINPPS